MSETKDLSESTPKTDRLAALLRPKATELVKAEPVKEVTTPPLQSPNEVVDNHIKDKMSGYWNKFSSMNLLKGFSGPSKVASELTGPKKKRKPRRKKAAPGEGKDIKDLANSVNRLYSIMQDSMELEKVVALDNQKRVKQRLQRSEKEKSDIVDTLGDGHGSRGRRSRRRGDKHRQPDLSDNMKEVIGLSLFGLAGFIKGKMDEVHKDIGEVESKIESFTSELGTDDYFDLGDEFKSLSESVDKDMTDGLKEYTDDIMKQLELAFAEKLNPPVDGPGEVNKELEKAAKVEPEIEPVPVTDSEGRAVTTGSGGRLVTMPEKTAEIPPLEKMTEPEVEGRKTTREPRKPMEQAKEQPTATKLKELVQRGESFGGNASAYNLPAKEGTKRTYGKDAVPGLGKKIEDMTIREIMDAQAQGQLFAVGKWQMIPDTFRDMVEKLHVPDDQKFSDSFQDSLWERYFINIKRPVIGMYLRGERYKNGDEITKEDVMLQMAAEWAALPSPVTGQVALKNRSGKIIPETSRQVTRGKSFYSGTGGNKALISLAEMSAAVDRLAPPEQRTRVAGNQVIIGQKEVVVERTNTIHPSEPSKQAALEDKLYGPRPL